jgi:phosphoribosylglycinamide formyltransferase-1
MQALIEAIAQGELPAEIVMVLSNKQDAIILQRAREHGIPAMFVDPTGLSKEAFDEKISGMLRAARVDKILLIGYMKILSPSFVAAWDRKIINVHPSLLPKYAGLMSGAVHQAVLDAGDTIAGCTIHFVNEILDGGEIILQKTCAVEPGDTVQSLKEKVQALESVAFVEVIKQLLSGGSCGVH